MTSEHYPLKMAAQFDVPMTTLIYTRPAELSAFSLCLARNMNVDKQKVNGIFGNSQVTWLSMLGDIES